MKYLNKFANAKANEMLEYCKKDFHAIINFENLLISLSNESIISVTSAEPSDNEGCKPMTKT
eukprot:8397055-Ditylum_brightwellii.AAC.1